MPGLTYPTAPWPSAFAASGEIITTTSPDTAAIRRPYNITNRGLELHVGLPLDGRRPILPGTTSQESLPLRPFQTLTFGLNCEKRSAAREENRFLAIKLHRFGNYWQRVDCNVDCLRQKTIENTFPGREQKSGRPPAF
jgi:hypothetical protein